MRERLWSFLSSHTSRVCVRKCGRFCISPPRRYRCHGSRDAATGTGMLAVFTHLFPSNLSFFHEMRFAFDAATDTRGVSIFRLDFFFRESWAMIVVG